MSTPSKPVAVLIADVHYNPTTLPLADAAMRMAINKANELNVPFIVAGDLHDTKALLRGECVKAMIDTFKTCKVRSYVLVGNHDRLNEKSEAHSLEFLRPYTEVIDRPTYLLKANVTLLPYFSDSADLEEFFKAQDKGGTFIIHQGVQSANMGHYVQDKTSLPKETFQDFRVISGHYHTRQDVECVLNRKSAIGLFSYIGNPYTLNFAEANDPEKGFQILMDDGSLQFVSTNLRKHVVVELTVGCRNFNPTAWDKYRPGDKLWIKVRGPKSAVSKVSKVSFEQLKGQDFKLDLIPDDAEETTQQVDKLQDTEVLDNLIDSLGETKEQKTRLKGLWREIL